MRRRKVQGPDGQPVDAIEFSFQNVREYWNEYLLDDGTLLKLKPVATEVFRVENQYDAEGNPIYILRSRNVLVVNAAETVRRPESEKQGDSP